MAALLRFQERRIAARAKEKEMDYYDLLNCLSARFPINESYAPLKRGDRVRIKEGYEGPGDVYYYLGKSAYSSDTVMVASDGHTWEFVADAIEPYPYTREERIERAIEDFEDASGVRLTTDEYVVLFAILDAGV